MILSLKVRIVLSLRLSNSHLLEHFFSGKSLKYDLEGKWLSPYLQLLHPLLRVVEQERYTSLSLPPLALATTTFNSAKDGARRLPTRFTVAAGDCLLLITHALATYSTELVRKEEQEKERKQKDKEQQQKQKIGRAHV